jgi:hypothetical protein
MSTPTIALWRRWLLVFVTAAGCNSGGIGGASLKVTVSGTVPGAIQPTPLAGAAVAVDLADGKRVEAIADASGVADVVGIDWEKGPVNVTAYAADHTVFTELGVAKTDAFSVNLDSTRAPTSVNVAGTLKGKDTINDDVTLSATTPDSTFFQDSTGSYSMTVPSGEAFTMVGLDWVLAGGVGVSSRGVAQTFLKWARLDQPASSGDVTADFDFGAATALTPVTVHGHADIPGGASGPLSRSFAYYVVSTVESAGAAFIGAPTLSDVTKDASGFDWSGQYVQLDGATPMTTYEIANQDGSGTLAFEMSYPTDGEQLTDLLPLPDSATTPIQLSDGASFGNAPASLSWVSLHLTVGTAPTVKLAWVVRQKNGPFAQLNVPALPTGADPATVFGGAQISGQIRYCGGAFDDRNCARVALSHSFNVTQ